MEAVPALTKTTKTRKEEEIGQHKGCTSKARLPYAGKQARKFDKRSYILDVNR